MPIISRKDQLHFLRLIWTIGADNGPKIRAEKGAVISSCQQGLRKALKSHRREKFTGFNGDERRKKSRKRNMKLIKLSSYVTVFSFNVSSSFHSTSF